MSDATSRREDLFGVHSSRGLRGHHNLGREVRQQALGMAAGRVENSYFDSQTENKESKGGGVMVGCF